MTAVPLLTAVDLGRLQAAIPAGGETLQELREAALLRLFIVHGLRTTDAWAVHWSGFTRDEDGTPWLEFRGKADRERRRLDEETAAALDAYRAALPHEFPEVFQGLHVNEMFGAMDGTARRAGVVMQSHQAVRNTWLASGWRRR